MRAALQEILSLSDIGNKYFQEKEPWKTKNKDVLFNCLNLVKILGLIIQPYLPQTSEKILDLLCCKEKDWKKLHDFNIKKIKKPKILFKKLDNEIIEELKKKTSKITEYKII